MHLKAVFISICLFVVSGSRSQPGTYQQLIHTATSGAGLFINAKPVNVRLDEKRIFLYNEWLYEQKKVRLPDSLYVQLINNSKQADTSHWRNEELPSSIIVQGKYTTVEGQTALNKFVSADSSHREWVLRQVNNYNKANPQDRIVFFFSRPVFDNSRTYAVVQYDNGHSWLMGGGGIKLYHLEEGVWKEMALLVHWSY